MLLDSVHPEAGCGAGPRERWELQPLRPQGSCSPDVPQGFPAVRTVGPRCFKMMGVLFLCPRSPSLRQCRAADGVRGGKRGWGTQRRHLEAEAPGSSSPLIGSSWDDKFAGPQPLSPSLRLTLQDSHSQGGHCRHHTWPRTLCLSSGSSVRRACNSPPLCRQLGTPQSP